MAFVINQAEIDRHTYNLMPGAFARAKACMLCGSTPVFRVASPDAERGRLYISDPSQSAFDPAHCVALCGKCWSTWVMWRARMGFDLHTHGVADVCGLSCLATSERRSRMGHASTSPLRIA